MRILAFAAAVCSALAVTSLCPGQELEKVIPLPDTFLGGDCGEFAAYNPANNQFYVAGSGDSVVIAIDGTTFAKVATLHFPGCVLAIGCNPATNKIYVAVDGEEVVIADGRTNRILTYVAVGYGPVAFACDTLADKVYCANYDLPGSITVIDGTNDRVMETIDLGDARPAALCCVPSAGKAYCCTDMGPVVIDSGTDSIIAWTRTEEPIEPLGVVWSPVQNRVYFGAEETLWVVDVASDSVRARIAPGEDWYFTGGLVYGAALDQVYTMDDERGNLLVIDCGSDSIIDDIPFAWEPPDDLGEFCADPFVGRVYCAEWGEDSSYVACCDVEPREVTHIAAGLDLIALAASTRERKLVCVDYCARDASVLNTDDGSLLATVELCNWTDVVVASPNADEIYVGCQRGELFVLDAETGRALARFDFNGQVEALCAGAGGHRLYCASGAWMSTAPDSVRVIDADADTLVAQLTVGQEPVQLYPDSLRRKIYCLSQSDTTIPVLCESTGSIKNAVILGFRPEAACLDPASGRLYVTSHVSDAPTQDLVAIDCGCDSVVASIKLRDGHHAICCNPSRKEVYAANVARDTVLVIDCITDSISATIEVTGGPGGLCYDPVHDRVYCALRLNGEVADIDCATRTVRSRIPVGGYAAGLWYNPGSGHLFATVGSAVVVLDPSTDSLIATIPVRGRPNGFAGSRSGERVYVNCDNPFISVIRDRLPSTATTGIYGSTLFMGRVFLRGSDPAQLVNCAGRVVAKLVPGDNAIGHLAAGVYFTVPIGGTRPTDKLVVIK